MSTLETNSIPPIAIIGVGSMGGAILQGLINASDERFSAIRVTTNSNESLERIKEFPGVIARSIESDPEANLKTVSGAGIVILGVKPWQIPDLLAEISPHIEPGTLVISVAAGVTISRMQDLLTDGVYVTRAMPNTPSLIGRGVTGIVAAENTPSELVDLTRTLFQSVGTVILTENEDQLDALSAISGSGPAYVFLFIEKFINAAKRLGFDDANAKTLTEQTFLGSTLLLDDQGGEAAQLRKNVTSPGGTTQQAIEVFENADLDETIDRALRAAIHRSKEIAADL